MEHQAFFWIVFHLLIALLLFIDLHLFHSKSHEVPFRKAVFYTFFWVATALAFNLYLYIALGSLQAIEFFAGYLVEKSLSVDNLFIFLTIFTYLGIKKQDQRRVLFWGIIGALVLRLSLILVGVVLIREFHWVFYLFGVFLICSAIRFIMQKEGSEEVERMKILSFFHRILPLSKQEPSGRFFVREGGKIRCTSLFLTLMVIESFDLIFALDSIPAVFAITTDPLIVYTSNVFAILGLRALYFVIAPSLEKLRYLKYGLAAVLVFIGVKMLIADLFPIPLSLSLAVIVGILLVTIVSSFSFSKR